MKKVIMTYLTRHNIFVLGVDQSLPEKTNVAQYIEARLWR